MVMESFKSVDYNRIANENKQLSIAVKNVFRRYGLKHVGDGWFSSSYGDFKVTASGGYENASIHVWISNRCWPIYNSTKLREDYQKIEKDYHARCAISVAYGNVYWGSNYEKQPY